MLVSIFRGKFAFVLKIITLLILSSLLVMLAQQAFATGEYAIAIFLAISTLALNFVYLTKRSVPMKFFLPGLLFLLAFVVGPILYTLAMSGFTYQTGNTLSKPEAIAQIQKLSVSQDENQTSYRFISLKLCYEVVSFLGIQRSRERADKTENCKVSFHVEG